MFIFLHLAISSSIAALKSRLAQLGDSTAELIKMSIQSELTIGDHFDALRQKVDIARETELEKIHKASDTLMSEIDAYESECLSCWRKVKQSNDHLVEDVSKRMRAFLVEQQAFLQSVQASDTELIILFYNFFMRKMLTFTSAQIPTMFRQVRSS